MAHKHMDAASPPMDYEQRGIGVPRVCILAESFPPTLGGAETHARILARELNALSMPTFVLTRREQVGSLPYELVDGVRTHRHSPSGMGRWGKFVGLPVAYAGLSRMRREYDLIYVCGFKILSIPAMLAARRFGKLCVLRAETYGEMSGEYASAYRKLPAIERVALQRVMSFRETLISKADAFVSISHQIYEELVRHGVTPNKVSQIPNGVDTKSFCPLDDQQRRAMRARLSLPVDAILVTYSGRLIRGKGLGFLLQAWDSIYASCPNAHLLIVGTGRGEATDVEGELHEFVRQRGLGACVTFVGWTEKVHEYLQSSDIFVLPSDHEGLPLSMIEAMACRLAVVVTSVGGMPEVVKHEVNGLLTPPRDVPAIAHGIARLIADREFARRLADQAYVTSRDYSIRIVAERHSALFKELYASRD